MPDVENSRGVNTVFCSPNSREPKHGAAERKSPETGLEREFELKIKRMLAARQCHKVFAIEPLQHFASWGRSVELFSWIVKLVIYNGEGGLEVVHQSTCRNFGKGNSDSFTLPTVTTDNTGPRP